MSAIATGNSVVATVTSKNKLFYFYNNAPIPENNLQKIAPYKSVGTFFLNKARRSLFFLSSNLYVFFFFFFFSNKKNFNNDFTTLCKSSIKPPPPFQRSPLPLISPPFQGKKVNKPPLPSPNYSSLINYRLY